MSDWSGSIIPEDVRHIFLAIHKENKKMVIRMFGNDSDILQMLFLAASRNQNVWDALYERMSHIEMAKMRLMEKEGGNT